MTTRAAPAAVSLASEDAHRRWPKTRARRWWLGGSQASIWLEDLEWTALAGLNAPECRAGEIEGWLYRLDRSLVARLLETYRRDKNPGHALYDLIRTRTVKPPAKGPPAPSYSQWLDSTDAYLNQEIRTTSGYRPTAKEARSAVVRLRLIGSASTPDDLPGVAEKLAKALASPADLDLPDPLVAVPFRSVNSVTDPSVRWARNLAVTLFAAGQFTMATHRAEHFDTYPLTLLKGLALNLLETPRELDRTLKSLERGGGAVAWEPSRAGWLSPHSVRCALRIRSTSTSA